MNKTKYTRINKKSWLHFIFNDLSNLLRQFLSNSQKKKKKLRHVFYWKRQRVTEMKSDNERILYLLNTSTNTTLLHLLIVAFHLHRFQWTTGIRAIFKSTLSYEQRRCITMVETSSTSISHFDENSSRLFIHFGYICPSRKNIFKSITCSAKTS